MYSQRRRRNLGEQTISDLKAATKLLDEGITMKHDASADLQNVASLGQDKAFKVEITFELDNLEMACIAVHHESQSSE